MNKLKKEVKKLKLKKLLIYDVTLKFAKTEVFVKRGFKILIYLFQNFNFSFNFKIFSEF